jgi:hypothetical protein
MELVQLQRIIEQKALSEIKSAMQFIDKQAISAGITPKDLMTQIAIIITQKQLLNN